MDRYIKSCYICKRIKAYREGKQGFLKSFSIPKRYWIDISVDFIIYLPECKRFGKICINIMVVVDRLSQKKKFVALENIEVETVV